MNYWKSLTKHWKRIHTVILLAVLVVFAAAITAGVSVSAANGDELVIFIKDNVGAGTGDGSSAANALTPSKLLAEEYNTQNKEENYRKAFQMNTALYQAWKQIIESGKKEATIVICGEYTINNENCYVEDASWTGADFSYVASALGVSDEYSTIVKSDITITYTSVYNGVDYRNKNENPHGVAARLILRENTHLCFPTSTTNENITFISTDRAQTTQRAFLAASSCNMLLGNGTNFNGNPLGFRVLGGSRSNSLENRGSTNITVDIGEGNQIGDIIGLSNGDFLHTGPNGEKVSSNITIKSGTIVGDIIGDGASANTVGINGNVNITISGGKIQGYIYGVNEGFYNSDGRVNLTITGGDFWYCKGIHPTDGTLSKGDRAEFGTLSPSYAEVNLSNYTGAAYPVTSRVADGFTVIMPSSTTITSLQRKAVSDYMQAMADVRWTTNVTIDYSQQPGGSNNLIFEPGVNYVGMPFNNYKAALEEFQSVLVGGVVPAGTDTGWNTFPGNSCATSVRHAWQIISPTTTFDSSKDLNPVLNSGVLPVGDIDWTQYDKTTYCTDSVIDYYTANNLQQIVYEAYAKASLGDALVRYSHVDAPSGSIAGHTYMITSSDFVVVRDPNTKAIIPEQSYFKLTGQNNAIRNRTINGVVYQTSWDIGLELTFADLYAGKYLPVTCRELLYGTIGVTDEMHDAPTSTDLGYGNLYGTLESNYTMLSVTLSVKDAGGNVVTSATAFPYSKTFHLVELSDDLDLDSLSSGDYSFVVSYKAGFASGAGNATSVAEHVAMEKGFVKGTDMVIYISNSGTGDGSSPENALGDDLAANAAIVDTDHNKANYSQTALYKAWDKIIKSGKAKATIVICGDYRITPVMTQTQAGWSNADMRYTTQVANPSGTTITYTSVYNGVDYRKTNNAKITLVSNGKTTNIFFPTATTTENLIFDYSGAGTHLIGINPSELYLGNNTTFTDTTVFSIVGGVRNTAVTTSSNIIVDIGDNNTIGNISGLSNTAGNTGTANITVKSGTVVGVIKGDGDTTTSGSVNITLEGGVFQNKIYGRYIGTTGAVKVKVTGGVFSNTSRILANQSANNASATLNLIAAPPATASQISHQYFGSVENPLVIFISNTNTENGDGSGKDADNPMWDDLRTAASYGNTLNAGRTQETALHRAWEECIAAGGGTIVFIDHYTISTGMCNYYNGWSNADMKYLGTGYTPSDIKITYTSVYGGVDYRTTNGAMVDLTQRTHINFPTATYTENITFNSPESREAANNTPETYLCGNSTTLHLGPGTKFTGVPSHFEIFGGPRTNGTGANGSNIILDIGNENAVNHIHGLSYGANDHSGDSNITILSGTVLGNVYGDGVQVGTTGDVNITVSGGVVNGTIYGVDAGFADTNGSVNITVTGGDVNAIKVSDDSLHNASHYLPANSTLDLSALEEEDRLAILDTAGSGFNHDGPLVIYVKDEFGAGKGDGSSAANALRPSIVNTPGLGVNAQMNAALFQAWEKIIASGKAEATIVICGNYTIGDSLGYTENGWSNVDFRYNKNPLPGITVTYTSNYAGVDYRTNGSNAAIRLTQRAQFAFPTATKTADLTFISSGRINNTTLVGGSGCDFHLGNGTNFKVENAANAQNPVTMEDFYILGGVRSNGAATSGSTNVIVDIGDTNNIGNIYGLSYGGTAHTGDSRITVNSGIVHGNIAGDGVVPKQVGINGHVYITVNGGTIYGNIYGVTEGFVNADGTVTVNINGGKIVENEDPLRIFVTDGIDGLLYNAPVSVTNAKLNIDYDKVDGLTAAIVKEQHTNSTTDPEEDYGWFAYTPTGEQAVICTVTYQDTVDPANKVTVEIKELNPTLPTWTKSGYTFTGWWVDNANGGDFVAGGKTFAPRKNLTLYTVWDGYYTITIPDILYINNNTSYITADLDNAPGRATLIIDIETLHNFRLQLTDEHSVYVPYKLRWDGGEVSSNGATVDISLTGTSDKQIYGVLTGDIPYAGIYQDPITYTITYDSDAISHSVFPASFLNP